MREGEFNNPANPNSLVPFALSNAGDDVFLLEADAAGNLLRFVDHAEFGAAPGGVTIGRFPNGTGPFGLLESPTLGSANTANSTEYAAWVATAFPPNFPLALTGPTLDPDSDGINNVGEWAFGLRPTESDISPLQIEPDATGAFVVRFTSRIGLTDVSVVVGVSQDLATWDETGNQLETISQISQGNGVSLTTARLKPSGSDRRFVRLTVRP